MIMNCLWKKKSEPMGREKKEHTKSTHLCNKLQPSAIKYITKVPTGIKRKSHWRT